MVSELLNQSSSSGSTPVISSQCFDSQTSPRLSASRYCATPKDTSTCTQRILCQRCAGAASTYPRWRRIPGSHGKKRISSIARWITAKNRLWIMAEMERELIVERTRAGLAAAREQGRVGGRRRVMTEDVVEQCRRMLENGATRQQVADVTGVDVKTIYKYLPAT